MFILHLLSLFFITFSQYLLDNLSGLVIAIFYPMFMVALLSWENSWKNIIQCAQSSRSLFTFCLDWLKCGFIEIIEVYIHVLKVCLIFVFFFFCKKIYLIFLPLFLGRIRNRLIEKVYLFNIFLTFFTMLCFFLLTFFVKMLWQKFNRFLNTTFWPHCVMFSELKKDYPSTILTTFFLHL